MVSREIPNTPLPKDIIKRWLCRFPYTHAHANGLPIIFSILLTIRTEQRIQLNWIFGGQHIRISIRVSMCVFVCVHWWVYIWLWKNEREKKRNKAHGCHNWRPYRASSRSALCSLSLSVFLIILHLCRSSRGYRIHFLFQWHNWAIHRRVLVLLFYCDFAHTFLLFFLFLFLFLR